MFDMLSLSTGYSSLAECKRIAKGYLFPSVVGKTRAFWVLAAKSRA